MIKVRKSRIEEKYQLYQIHLSSILHYCSSHYSRESIEAWVELKSPHHYQNKLGSHYYLVAELNQEILGFGLLNINKKSIDNLYVKPNMNGFGVGRAILEGLEHLAIKNNISELSLSSTLNAVGFYHRMGYVGDIVGSFKLSSGYQLKCINMTKKLVD